MSHTFIAQVTIHKKGLVDKLEHPFGFRLPAITLGLEVVLVVLVTLALLRMSARLFANSLGWLLIPLVLGMAALLPTTLRKRSWKELGIHQTGIRRSIYLCVLACAVLFPVVLGGMMLAKRFGLTIPLAPVVQENDWGGWLFYQFFYVAVAEELFFRGYLQGTLLRIVEGAAPLRRWFWNGMTVVVSAILFALVHWFVLGTMIAVLTFFPGLALGWLFLRRRSLIAPILFHGLANTFYAVGVSFFG